MANRKKEDQGKRINLQLPTDDYELANSVASKRKQTISEFVRRAVDFQAWLETIMPEVEGFGADELAKIALARKQLAELEKQQNELLVEDSMQEEQEIDSESHSLGLVKQPKSASAQASRSKLPTLSLGEKQRLQNHT